MTASPSRRGRRRASTGQARRAVTLGIASSLALVAFGFRITSASCAAPWIETNGWTSQPVEVEPGQTLEVVGEAWSLDCDDTGGASVGACGLQQDADPAPQQPMTDITITVRRPAGPLSWVVADGVDAGADLGFRVSITLPSELREGFYVLEASTPDYTTYDPIDLVIR